MAQQHPGDTYRLLSAKPLPQSRRKPARADTFDAGQLQVTPIGLRFPKDLSFSDWFGAGLRLARINESLMWCIGDWVAYGLNNYTDRYHRAIEEVGLDYKTIRNYTWVARRFDWSRRRSDLSFQHHAEVAALATEEQDAWLELAARNKWSRNKLRQQLREARLQMPDDLGAEPETVKLVVAHETAQRWRRAAQQMSMPLETWIAAAVDAQSSSIQRREQLEARSPGS